MFTIEGKYTKAKIFTNDIEEGALSQVYDVCNNPAFKNSPISIMPDVHQGAGICIGFTAHMTDKIIPNVVGVDIGCGMFTINLGNVEINKPSLDDFIKNNIPSGFNGRKNPTVELTKEEKNVCDRLNLNTENHLCKLGTLGGGNHFIEIDIDVNNNKYLIIHSGSRNFGYKIASHYQKLAKERPQRKQKEKINQVIEKLKSQGRHQEIEQTIKKMKKKTPKVKSNLSYLEGNLAQEYIEDMRVAQKYAERNREIIANDILKYMDIFVVEEEWQTIHNYIGEDNIIRKGAVSAYEDEKILIPLNMRDGSIIAIGKGNTDWNYSAPHGAGRIMSRSEAKEKLDLDEFHKAMNGIYSSSIKQSTLDEAPGAYKNKKSILDNISDTVKIHKQIIPIYNFKAH